jgi:putative hemolysin
MKGSLLAWVAAVLAVACTESPPQRPNPASAHCVAQGGTHVRERLPDGGEYGVCRFEDNRECEEWALLRGECPSGGVRVTGYATAAARYSAITGGRYAVLGRSGTAEEEGRCTLPGGKECDAEAYYRGQCGRSST